MNEVSWGGQLKHLIGFAALHESLLQLSWLSGAIVSSVCTISPSSFQRCSHTGHCSVRLRHCRWRRSTISVVVGSTRVSSCLRERSSIGLILEGRGRRRPDSSGAIFREHLTSHQGGSILLLRSKCGSSVGIREPGRECIQPLHC